MTQLPAGSLRDTAELAKRYSETSQWQRARGLALIETAGITPGQSVLDLGCGTGELSLELARKVGHAGRVIAVDPAPARLERARASAPPGLDTLVFAQASGEDLHPVGDGSIDLVFSNYAIHWVLDMPALFDELHRVLRPGGRLVAEFLGRPIALFVELVHMMPDGRNATSENRFLEEPEWRAIIAGRGFDIVALRWPAFALDYESLESLFAWLEGTSHGAFDAGKLGPDERAALAARFPGALTCPCTSLRLELRRGA